jgi:hypothetical protein
MIDENAFGLLVSYFQIEDDEYGLEPEEFVARYRAFRAALDECIAGLALGQDARAVDLGHAVYLEISEGDETEDPFHWLRDVRARLGARDFVTVGVLSHGSRWVEEEASDPDAEEAQLGGVRVHRVSLPSEPFRRALYADAASRVDDDCPGWGPGLYVDAEAIEALKKKLKNVPTALVASGATFYRFAR